MNYYTPRYKMQTSLQNHPEVGLINDLSRWICCQFKESLGHKGYAYTLVDNYGSAHLLYVNRVDGELELRSETLIINLMSVQLPVFTLMKYPFPDFLIDALETISVPLAFETLGRAAEQFAKINSRDGSSRRRISTGEL